MAFDSTPEFRITSQQQLEILYSKYQLIPRIKQEFIEAKAPELLAQKDIPVAFGLDLLVQISLHRRARIATMVGLLKTHFTSEHPEQEAADMILKAAEADIVDIETRQTVDELTGRLLKWHDVLVRYEVTEDVQKALDQFQFPLPMIVPPEPVHHNRQTGYQTIKGSIILKNNHHEDDVCLDHINRVNAIPLRLNADVVAFVQNQWRNLDKQKEDESWDEFRKRKEAFEKYDTIAHDVIQAVQAQGDRFWLTHRYDKRGRVYSQGYHINYQGNDWNKACIEFADGEVLNER